MELIISKLSRVYRKNLFSGLVVLGIALFTLNTAYSKSDPVASSVAQVIKNLDKATESSVSGSPYNYGFHKDGGGMLNAYSYLNSLMSYEKFQSLLPMPIFNSGPHDATFLNLESAYSFGHYNPDFVKYFRSGIKPLLDNRKFVNKTKADVIHYGVLEKLQRLNKVYLYIEQNPDEFKHFRDQFVRKINANEWREYDYREYLPGMLRNGSEYWNWSETVYYFWVRRDLDGTRELWADVVQDILNAYE